MASKFQTDASLRTRSRTLGGEGQLAVHHDGRHLEDLEPGCAGRGLAGVGIRGGWRHVNVEVLEA